MHYETSNGTGATGMCGHKHLTRREALWCQCDREDSAVCTILACYDVTHSLETQAIGRDSVEVLPAACLDPQAVLVLTLDGDVVQRTTGPRTKLAQHRAAFLAKCQRVGMAGRAFLAPTLECYTSGMVAMG